MAEKIIKTVKFLPEFLQTGKNSKFLSSTIDQLIQKPRLERLDGYIGSSRTPNYSTSDVYISESTPLRANYQLAPSLIVRTDEGEVSDVIGISDLVNEIQLNGGDADNFDKLFRTQYYSYNAHIDSDKFINFQNYYWAVNGPPGIDISSTIDVVNDIIGKDQYVTPVDSGNFALMNGMKIRFTGDVTPNSYKNKFYYVEGVGKSIQLIDEDTLRVSEKIASVYNDSFDGSFFDEYPFDSNKRLPLTPDYITINRASSDLNPWSRYNRWVEKSVIEASYQINGLEPRLPSGMRAKRPVIEFVPNIKLYNFGTTGLEPVTLIDSITTDAFSVVEGSFGHHADGILLQQDDRVIFTADLDKDVRGKIYRVNFVNIEGYLRLTLVEDHDPTYGDSIFIISGNKFGGVSWWYNGNEWVKSQQHSKLNQPPLFDLFDDNEKSYADSEYYQSDFKGSKVFGYDEGSGTADPVLGFPLNYQNSIGVGSYLFKNYLTSDTIVISNETENSKTISTAETFLKIGDLYYNAWKSLSEYPIPLITSPLTATPYYDIPLGLTNNPFNGPITNFTLSDYRDHISTSSETRLISNINPMPFALMFIGKKEHSVIDAVTSAADHYNNFKLAFIKKITELSIEDDPVRAVDEALRSLNISKTSSSPYNLSDMLAYGDDYTEKSYIVNNSNIDEYPINDVYNSNELNLRSILIYLNGVLLLKDRDYDFVANDAYVKFKTVLNIGDVILIRDFSNTVGCYVPPTPSKLGLYPSYQPQIFADSSYLTTATVIQGHDGSIVVAFNDYRDDVILEFEKRVYNNIKTEYRSELLNPYSVLPGAFRDTGYTQQQIENITQQDFIKWTATYGVDPTTNVAFDPTESRSWNYVGSYIPQVDLSIRGNWRSWFYNLYDTDKPHLCPWEMLGFSQKPVWWNSEYGAAPYLPTNTALWEDLENGYIRGGNNPGVNSLYVRPGLAQIKPVDADGNLIDPQLLAINILDSNIREPWKFGEWGAAETAWRRSSYWPFALQKVLALTLPATYAALMYDPIRLKKNASNQWVYGDNNSFLNLTEMPVQGLDNQLTSGYSVYVAEVGRLRTADYNNELLNDLRNANINLFYKVGGFVDKSQLQISIDAYDPLSTAPGALLQPEDYDLILNVSNPIRETAISAIIVQKTDGKYLVRGLDSKKPYFTIYPAIRSASTPAITVGGVSENFLTWAPSSSGGATGLSSADTTSVSSAATGTFYEKGTYVKYGSNFYIVKISHRSGSTFEANYFEKIPSLPVKGGARVQTAFSFDKTATINVPYGTLYNTNQEIYDLIVGYGEWLKDQGFIFNQYNSDLQSTLDWDYTAKEFLFWTTQNWANNNIIALSPFSDQLEIKFNDSVIDNIFNSFYEYSILEASGKPLDKKYLNVVRDEGRCTIKTVNDYRGIYFARLRSVQKEHAMVFNNTTIFNDSIYDIEAGYRQARMKLLGFRTANWNGDYFSPGFVYDTAVISDWKKFTDYRFETVVRFNSSYYSAKKNLSGTEKFNFDNWRLLGKKPVAALIPNFDYKINQFEDFYSLDTNNFDEGQQRAAQQLIGYTPRVYLNNIFPDPVAQYKFYQGFIREKGTKNSVLKLQRATVQNLDGKIDYNEEWAFRMGYYGSYSSYREIEFTLSEGSFYENPQIVVFTNTNVISTGTDLKITVSKSNLAIKPSNYQAENTFAVLDSSKEDVFAVSDAGYVRFDDVNFTALNESEFLAFTSTNIIKEGGTVWLANTKINDWTVLRKSLSSAKLLRVDIDINSENTYNFTVDKPNEFSVGEIINIEEFDSTVNGIYKISSIIDKDTFAVVSTATEILDSIQPENPGLVFKFTNTRYNSFDSLPSDRELLALPRNSKVWVDNDGNNNWKVYQKIKNYRNTAYTSSSFPLNQSAGYTISKQKESLIMVSNPDFIDADKNYGRISVYNKNNSFSSLQFSYGINQTSSQTYYDKATPTGFGSSLFYDSKEFIDSTGPTGYGLFFAGAPLASKVSIPSTSTVLGTLIEQGLIKISSVNALTGEEKEVLVAASPSPSSYERYGSSIFVANKDDYKILFVGASNTPTLGTGTVYRYLLTTSTVNTGTVNLTTTASIALNYSSVLRIDIVNSGTNYKVGDVITITSELASAPLNVTVSKINAAGSIRAFESPLDNSVLYNVVPGSSILGSVSQHPTSGITASLTIVTSDEIGSQWGYSIAGSNSNSFARNRGVVAVGAPGFSQGKGFVAVYTNTATEFSQYLPSPFENNSNFGSSISLSDSGSYIFVSAPNARNADQSYGKVAVYHRESSAQTFTLTQIISNPVPGVGMKFGQSIDINSTDDELVISAIGTNRRINLTFDEYTRLLTSTPEPYDNDPNSDRSEQETSYDIDATYFIDRVVYSGSVYVYNRKNNLFKVADELPPVNINSGTNFGYNISINDESIFVGAPAIIGSTTTNSAFYQFYKIDQTAASWKLLRSQEPLINVDSIEKVTLIDTLKEQVVDYLEVVDPLKGKIVGIASQELSYKLSYDPAIYSVGDDSVVVDINTNWLDEHVGELWWDISSVKYPWYEQGEVEYRRNYWGVPFPGSTIDVYEWVKTTLLPSQWSALANTREGIDQGVSGQPKYLNDDNLSVRQVFNEISGNLTNYYYYWVKNTLIVPDAKNRRISAFQVAQLIENPKLQGQKFVEILSSNAVAIANCAGQLVGERINLNIASDEITSSIPRHTEWVILQEGSATSTPNSVLENKMLDSLKGTDSQGNLVPDPSLSPRERYGISIRPRQSMFKDRSAALRNIFEYVNGVLIDQRITGVYSFENLNKEESPPDINSNEYDQVVEDNLDLDLVSTIGLETAELSCVVSNGKIIAVTIVNSGYGYKKPPTVEIADNKNLAKITTSIDELGRVILTKIVNAGKGFVLPPKLTVRPYTVLVLSDNTYNGKWTKFVWDNAEVILWRQDRGYFYGEKVKYNNNYYSAKYDISIGTGFNLADWNAISLDQVQGAWVREKTQLFNTPLYWDYVDWTSENYSEFKVIATTVNEIADLQKIILGVGDYVKVRNDGQGYYIILEKLDSGSQGSFNEEYDLVYAQNGTIQISDNIWNSVTGNLGFDKNTFDQTLYSQSADLELGFILTALKNDIFVGELKVYWNTLFFKSVRYALSEQKILDWAFKTSFINVVNFAGELKQLPIYKLADTKFYEDYILEAKPYHTQIRTFTVNHSVTENSKLHITDFDLPPVYDPTAGKIITVNSGSSYLNQYPWKSWAENYGSTDTVRINTITLRYDRISKDQTIDDLSVVDNFVGNGLRSEFELSWLAEPDANTISVFVDNNIVLKTDYEVVYFEKDYNDYNKRFSKIVFTVAIPEQGQNISVSYRKNTELLSAIDRTLAFYSPTNEMPGKDLPQLMSGLEYPHTSLEGISLNYSTRWGDTEIGFDNSSYEDEISFYTFTTSTSVSPALTNLIQLYDIDGIAVGQTLNVISSTSTFFAIEPKVLTVNTAAKTISVNTPITSAIPAGSKIEFWSYNDSPSILDTQYVGGFVVDGAFIPITTASGAIEIDGETFLNPNNSYAPEELIAGETAESIGINVYTKGPVQAPIIVASSLDIFDAYTTTTRVLNVVPPNPSAVIVSYSNSVVTATIVQTATNLTATLYLSTVTGFSIGDPFYIIKGILENTRVTGFVENNGITISNPIYEDIAAGTFVQAVKENRPTIFDYVQYNYTGTTFTQANQFSIDWANDNGRHPVLYVAPQAKVGRLNYTVISIGAASTENQTGFVDSGSIVITKDEASLAYDCERRKLLGHSCDEVPLLPLLDAEIESLGSIDTVKSAYVTLNGTALPLGGSTGTYYILTASNPKNRRASVKIYGLGLGVSVISAWFFGTEQKLWNEIKEEIIPISKSTKTFTGIATTNTSIITNISTTTDIIPGQTKVYARNATGADILPAGTPVVDLTGDTITLQFPLFPIAFSTGTTATVELSIVNLYSEIPVPGNYDVGSIEPQIANTIVEFKNEGVAASRMLVAPQINYYSVANPLYNTFPITNKKFDGSPNLFTINEIRVYLNGSELRRGFDYTLNETINLVKIDSTIMKVGDVIAILNKPGSGGPGEQDYEYDIYDGILRLCVSGRAQLSSPTITTFNTQHAGWNTDWQGEIKIITYNNYDQQLMRTETFDGNPSGRFRISRPVLDENYIWVFINGNPITNFADFSILDDQVTVQLTDAYTLKYSDVVTIVSFASNKTTADIVGYRIFNDLFNRYHYKRLSKENTTQLARSLADVDPYIMVKNANVLTAPIVEKNIPGVVLINGERIEFFKIYSFVDSVEILNSGTYYAAGDGFVFSGTNWITPHVGVINELGNSLEEGVFSLTTSSVGIYDGLTIPSPTEFTSTTGIGTSATFKINLANYSVLGQLRRATLGTSAKVYSQADTEVVDMGTTQSIPYADKLLKQSILTESGVNSYEISTSSFNYYVNTATFSTSTWINDGITLTTLRLEDGRAIPPENQLEVYYGGRKLNKDYTYYQDPTVSYDSQELRKISGQTQLNFTATTAGLPNLTANIGTVYIVTTTNQVWVFENSLAETAVSGYVYKGLIRKEPEFSLNTSTQRINLNIPGGVDDGVRLTLVKREFSTDNLWNNNNTSLLDSNSNQAKFLRARPATLPDDQYYGGDFEITDDTDEALKNDQGDPLIGIN